MFLSRAFTRGALNVEQKVQRELEAMKEGTRAPSNTGERGGKGWMVREKGSRRKSQEQKDAREETRLVNRRDALRETRDDASYTRRDTRQSKTRINLGLFFLSATLLATLYIAGFNLTFLTARARVPYD